MNTYVLHNNYCHYIICWENAVNGLNVLSILTNIKWIFGCEYCAYIGTHLKKT